MRWNIFNTNKKDIDSAFKSIDRIADNLEKIAKSLDQYLNRNTYIVVDTRKDKAVDPFDFLEEEW